MSKAAAIAECKKLVRNRGIQYISRDLIYRDPIFEPYRVRSGCRALLVDAELEGELIQAFPDIVAAWKQLYDQHGICALNHTWATKNYHNKLSKTTIQSCLSLKHIANHLQCSDAYQQEVHDRNFRPMVTNQHGTTEVWTAAKFDKISEEIVAKFGCISSTVLAKNGYSGYLNHIKQFGPDINAIRRKHGVDKVEMRDIDDQPWLSLIEVSVANYMLARGVIIAKGENYPAAYSTLSGRTHGIYDMHFVALVGEQKGKRWRFLGAHLEDVETMQRFELSRSNFMRMIQPFLLLSTKNVSQMLRCQRSLYLSLETAQSSVSMLPGLLFQQLSCPLSMTPSKKQWLSVRRCRTRNYQHQTG